MALERHGIGPGSPVLDRVGSLLAATGTPAFLVGGCVRDAFLPSSRIHGLAADLGGSLAPLDPSRGIYRIVVPGRTNGDDGRSWVIDVTGFSGPIEEDLARRDFTIDAMALDLKDMGTADWPSRVIDPYGGQTDLLQKRVRAVSPSVFQSDPGRLLRSVRLCSQLGFALNPDTSQLVRSEAHRVEQVSPERVRDELMAIFAMANTKGYLDILDRLGLLCRVIPELEATKGVEQPVVHYWDVWWHTLHCVEAAERITLGHQNSPVFMLAPWTPEADGYFGESIGDGHSRRTILKLGALFHDIAKPQTKAVDENGRTRFLGHSELGASVARQRLRQLRLGSRAIGLVARMVEHHLRPSNMSKGTEIPTPKAIYRYYRDVGEAAVDTLFLALADYLAAKGPNLTLEHWSAHARMIGCILEGGKQQPKASGPDRLVTGHDVMKHLAMGPGPAVGEILETLVEAQASGKIHTREEALALAEQSMPGRQVGE